MANTNPDEVVRLRTAATAQEAHAWRLALDAERIEARVVGDELDTGLGSLDSVRAELWVHRRDIDRARAVLEAYRSAPTVGDEGPETP